MKQLGGHHLALLLSLVFLASPTTASAQNGERSGFSIGIGLGGNVVPNLEEVGVTFKIAPGFEVVDGLDLEIETGFRKTENSSGELGMWPFLLGVRYSLLDIDAPVIPFVGMHFGPGLSFEGDGADGLYVDSQVIGFQFSGGLDVPVSKNYGIGGELSYAYFAPTDGYDSSVYHFFDFTLEVRLGF